MERRNMQLGANLLRREPVVPLAGLVCQIHLVTVGDKFPDAHEPNRKQKGLVRAGTDNDCTLDDFGFHGLPELRSGFLLPFH